jgi:hypothetical protein
MQIFKVAGRQHIYRGEWKQACVRENELLRSEEAETIIWRSTDAVAESHRSSGWSDPAVAFKEEPGYLWSDFSGALVELLLGEVGDWMGQDQKPVVWYPPRLGHGIRCPYELVGDDGG